METKNAYKEIMTVLNKYKDIIIFNIPDLKREADIHLYGLELKEKYGLNIDPKRINSLEWNKIGEYMSIGKWGKKYNRTISWSIDGRQPNDEILLSISFNPSFGLLSSYAFLRSSNKSSISKRYFFLVSSSFNISIFSILFCRF